MIGVFGGSGFYEFMDGGIEVPTPTPYGEPASNPTVGQIGGVEVAFIPRHGRNHEYPPHLVPYRANAWAMHELGVDRMVAPAAVGSLKLEMAPGHFVIPDQIVDRTWGRAGTFSDGPQVRHIEFADPYDPVISELAATAMRNTGATVHEGATVAVLQGPRFSTRAESAHYRNAGWELLNMNQMPEAALALELGIRYCSISVVTDYDVGLGDHEAVTQDAVLTQFAASLDTLRTGLTALMPPLAAAELG